MYNVIKNNSYGLATFWGTRYFLGEGGSLFSGFIRSHKVLALLSGGRYYRNFTILSKYQTLISHKKNKTVSNRKKLK